jgi:hypothetical protein
MADGWTIENLRHGDGLLVIVGAGASHDCMPTSGTTGLTPPLTKDLAWGSAALVSQYEMAQPLLADLRIRLNRSQSTPSGDSLTLENALSEYLARAEFDTNVRRSVAAMRFFLRDLLWQSTNAVMAETGGITNYTGLVTTCIQWALRHNSHVCFVSFNYDPLLEIACKPHGRSSLGQLSPYLAGPHGSVLKPHGSVLWSWPYPGFPASRAINDPKGQVIDAGEPETLSYSTVSAGESPKDIVASTVDPTLVVPSIPAIALPMAGKSELVWPQEQNSFFLAELPNGAFGRVLSIGWRAAEPHFTSLLNRLIVPGAKYVIVGGSDDDARETTTNLSAPERQFGAVKQSGNGFWPFVADGELLIWLLGG